MFGSKPTYSLNSFLSSQTNSIPLDPATGKNWYEVAVAIKDLIKMSVYIPHIQSGPIRDDRLFNFSARLRDEKGNPIVVKQGDFYLTLQEVGRKKGQELSFEFLTVDQYPKEDIYLPSLLFKGVKEGESVRFTFDNQLFEFTCCQGLGFQNNRYLFEDVYEQVEESALGKPCHFKIDLPSIRQTFMNQEIGDTHYYINGLNSKTLLTDFSVYEKEHSAVSYKKLRVRSSEPYTLLAFGDQFCTKCDVGLFTICFDLAEQRDVSLSDIHLIESSSDWGLFQLWIIIPHQLDKNNVENLHEIGPKGRFVPSTRDRLENYCYGQYCMVSFKKPVFAFLTYHGGYLCLRSVSLSN